MRWAQGVHGFFFSYARCIIDSFDIANGNILEFLFLFGRL